MLNFTVSSQHVCHWLPRKTPLGPKVEQFLHSSNQEETFLGIESNEALSTAQMELCLTFIYSALFLPWCLAAKGFPDKYSGNNTTAITPYIQPCCQKGFRSLLGSCFR